MVFLLDRLTKPYSEPDINVPVGRVVLRTTQEKRAISVNLTLNYGIGTDLTFNSEQETKKLNPSTQPYRLAIENRGIVDIGEGNKAYNIDISSI